ncbi:hypothetical protein [Hymenobacter yonginensis]|uniref:Lipoprotein n=1 Tax=Hymenobacter yonginensis TaxID=748197 RepID=A0ABY7PTZ5_9BACT|nr:hypothetical protein [Hymenobacter yonginensis]WBO86380.1 hypothetical protein O9Z63_08980 [Hymenobacter yonginensis]
MGRFYLGLLIALVAGACSDDSAAREVRQAYRADSLVASTGFDTARHYTQPLCLQFRGKPLLSIGSQLSALDTSLTFNFDPNSGYNYWYPQISDYISTHPQLSVQLEDGAANGAVNFSADRKGRIFEVQGTWLLNVDSSQQATQAAVRLVVKRLFPCLPTTLPSTRKWQFIANGPQFTEVFKFMPPDTSMSPYYSLTYQVFFGKQANGRR